MYPFVRSHPYAVAAPSPTPSATVSSTRSAESAARTAAHQAAYVRWARARVTELKAQRGIVLERGEDT